MDASSHNPILTLDDDFESDLAALKQRANDALTARRERLIELQQQITDQTRSLANELEQDRIRLDSQQESASEQRREIEQQLEHLESLRNELSGDRSEWDSHQSSVIQRQEKLLTALAEQYERLEAVREDFTVREDAFHEQQLRFEHEQTTFFSLQMQQAEREEELDVAARNLKISQADLSEGQQAVAQREAELEQQLAEIETLRNECHQRQQELKTLEERTTHQRKQIAAQLRHTKSEALAEVERRKAEIDEMSRADDSQLRREVELAQQQANQLRNDIANRESRTDELQRQLATAQEQYANSVEKYEQAKQSQAQLQSELQQAQEKLTESLRKHDIHETKLAERLEQLKEAREENQKLREAAEAETNEIATVRSDAERLRGQVEVFQQQHAETKELLKEREAEIARLQQLVSENGCHETNDIASRKRIEELTRECSCLQEDLRAARERLDANGETSSDNADLQRRFEATTQEIRDLKQANRQLQEQLKQGSAAAAPSAAPIAADNGMDWEAQKRRLLAELDNEDAEVSHERAQERLRIEETIRVTDQVIAEKQLEIEELRQLLQDQSNNIGEVAIGASAIASMLDSDELIREERESLKELQTQWREKLRQAELDVSVERAKVARERTELEERMEQFQKQREKLEQELREGGADPAKKPNKRKWMDRLGIKHDDA